MERFYFCAGVAYQRLPSRLSQIAPLSVVNWKAGSVESNQSDHLTVPDRLDGFPFFPRILAEEKRTGGISLEHQLALDDCGDTRRLGHDACGLRPDGRPRRQRLNSRLIFSTTRCLDP